jgi:hypothetical protein
MCKAPISSDACGAKGKLAGAAVKASGANAVVGEDLLGLQSELPGQEETR